MNEKVMQATTTTIAANTILSQNVYRKIPAAINTTAINKMSKADIRENVLRFWWMDFIVTSSGTPYTSLYIVNLNRFLQENNPPYSDNTNETDKRPNQFGLRDRVEFCVEKKG
jgi:hypothetical protein